MPKIRLLSDHLVSQIAAGEVVERPASVVKELVENSLDAQAREVRIELEAGGKRRILVADDGIGMGRDDALLAFDRHATSKIDSFEDLQQVATLGFRGEALASIAAVARVELTTAEEPGDGHRVRIEGGRIKVAEPAARARGTTLEIASLFFNVPARRKFLKAPATELRRVVEVVQGYALARPDVKFSLQHQGRALLEAPPVKNSSTLEGARERIAQVFGRPFAGELTPLPAGADGIEGLVGKASTSRGRRLFVFVNRRLIRDRSVLATFYRAVRDEWKNEDYPSLFLFLDVPPEDVDVNVHPQKAEVRFRELSVLDRLYGRLREGLAAARGEEAAPLRSPVRPPAPAAWQGLGERPRVAPGGAKGVWPPQEDWKVRRADGVAAPPAPYGEGTKASPGPPAANAEERLATPSYTPEKRPVVPLSGRSGEERPFRLLGQYKGTLILLEGPDGLYLIDQHVAHERILYERLKLAMERESTPSQALLTPPVLELSPAEDLRLGEMQPGLEGCGFEVARLSGRSAALAAVPAVLSPDEAEDLLRTLLGESDEGGTGPEALRRRILEALAASRACKAAVKMHHPLSATEMEALVAELFVCENPYACPHGRPVVLEMTDSDLERRFKRR
ncbi:MAG: DNA mismatch repair endonuclease MutL [Acidobacteriota bacterium]